MNTLLALTFFYSLCLTTTRKRIVDNHNSELRALEERLKAAEERLKATAAAVQSGGSPKASANPTTNTGLFAETTLVERPKSKQSMASRPGTAGRAVEQHTVNGEFRRPPTPGASGSEDEK